MNEYERIHQQAAAATADKWRDHRPLTTEQLDGLADLLQEIRTGRSRRTVATTPSSKSSWQLMLPVKRPTETAAISNVIVDATADSASVRIRDPFSGWLDVYNPRQLPLPNFTVVGERCCSKCGLWKERDRFYSDKSRKDGLDPYCKLCRRDVHERGKRAA